jgi:hypothetical protein
VRRSELERLDRDALIARAEAAGVAKARILTRPELVDELVLRSATDDATKQKSRGLFGRARDLLARLVEQGLNKPDAAALIRAVGRPSWRPTAPAALPTLTLAEIYVAQGYRERAMDTLQRVLAAEPDHAAALGLLSRLRDQAFPVPAPKMPPEADEDDVRDAAPAEGEGPPPVPAREPPAVAPPPAASGGSAAEPTYMLDDSPLPTHYDVDECVAIPVVPRTIYVYWEARAKTIEHVRARMPEAALALRIAVVEPSWSGPRATLRDQEAAAPLGESFVSGLPAGSVVRAAVGLLRGGEFAAIAHSLAVEMPPAGPAPLAGRELVLFTPAGAAPVAHEDPLASAVFRAADRLRRDSAKANRHAQPVPVVRAALTGDGRARPLGSSERLASAPGRELE